MQGENIFQAIDRIKHDEDFIPHSLPMEPSFALPGSWEKVEILAQRVDRGEELWHPKDLVEAGFYDRNTNATLMRRVEAVSTRFFGRS